MPMSLWKHTLAGHNQDAMKEMVRLFEHDVFSIPKPEQLIQTVLHVATQPGDLVLDSFAGSGTTGAVAHKMSRRWVMIELGEHCHMHIIPRLKKVIDGEDQGAISEAVNWQGGGFRYYRLAPKPVAARPLGQVDHQQVLQRRNAGGGDGPQGGGADRYGDCCGTG